MSSSIPGAARKPSLIAERTQIGPITHLRLRGTIDETFDAGRLSDGLAGHVLIDLGRVERISSFGVRNWMQLTERLPTAAFGLYLMHMPPVLVDQLNMVEGFAGLAQVLSILAPYACEKCGEERVRVVDLVQASPLLATGGVPSFDCSSCGTGMQFADQAQEYFSFVVQHPIRGLDPTIVRYLGSLGVPRPTDQTNPVKIVQDDLTYVRLSSTIRKDLSVRRLASGLEGTVVYDFASVAQVVDGGGAALLEVVNQAATGATVVLWRLPPVVMLALRELQFSKNIAIANLLLPCECRSCGSCLPQTVGAQEYLQATTGASSSRPCGVCGAQSQLPQLEGAARLLAEHPADHVPLVQIAALEPKAASQLLHFSTVQGDPSPSTPSTPATPAPDGAAREQTQPPIIAATTDGSENLQLIKHLGRGGMAEVFLARQVGLRGFEKYVTVKRVLPHLAESPEFIEMLFAEARANARLTHPNVVQIFDVGSIGGVAHLTMEYVRGPDFKRVLVMARKAGLALPMPIALRVVADTAAGLHYAHTFVDPLGNFHPVIHRDVSPHNILISLDGAVKLSDFGIAKVNDGGEGTRPGTFKGKIHYSSPEQVRGLPLDARHDLFSLGIVLFEALTGFLPFKADSDVASLTAIAHNPMPDPRQAVPGIPQDVVNLVARALAKNPDERFQTVNEFREEIEEVMMRNRYRASPSDVSQHVKDLLGEQLKDFSPQRLAELQAASPPRSSSSSSLQAQSQPSFTPMSLTPTGFRSPPMDRTGTQPKTAIVAPQRPSAPRPHVASATGLTPAPSAATPRPRSSSSGLTPSPADTTPRSKSSSGVTPSSAGATPRPSAPGRTPALQVQPIAVEAGPKTGRAARLLLLGGLALAAAVGVVVTLTLRSRPAVEIAGLRPGEIVFLDGLEVDPLTLKPRPTAPPVVVAVAVDGVLRRMGTANVGTVLDLQPLFEAAPAEGQTARLSVKTKAPGCKVEIDGAATGSPTPLSTTIAAGKVLTLAVNCEGKPGWTSRVLGVTGQFLEIAADERPALNP